MIALIACALCLAAATTGILTVSCWRTGEPRTRPLALLVGLAPPTMALGLYLATGMPGLPSQPAASRDVHAIPWSGLETDDPLLMVARLGEAAAAPGATAEASAMLGRAYADQGRFAEAARAFAVADAADPGRATLQRDLAMALTAAARGVSADAAAKLQQAAAGAPRDPLTQSLQALGFLQTDRPDMAVALLQALPATLAERDPMRAALADQVEAMVAYAGIELSAHIVPSGPVLVAADEEQAELAQPSATPPRSPALAPLQRLAEQLKRRLALQPTDVEGWRRLGLARAALGDAAQAREAFANAAALASERVDVQLDLARAALWADANGGVPETAVAAYRNVLSAAPDNSEALWYLGMAERDGGDGAAARLTWERLLRSLPAGAPEQASVQRRLDELIGR
ncbi:MAG: tetratricopeptide repeat protein [Alphaproteobacteria bacterium]|nr:tetratricopeptide repeat protein [Alphaproteobacteria bacterium]